MSGSGSPIYANCSLGWGTIINPINANIGLTEANSEARYLGKYYWSKGPDGKSRIIKIVKNVRGSALAARNLLTYSTTADRWGLDVSIATADQGPCAGAVEEGYSGGVPNLMYFRMVVAAEKMGLVLQTTSDARNTITNGGYITCAADDGTFTGQSTVSLDAIQNCIGNALRATTNVTDAAAVVNCQLSLLR